MMPVFDHFSEAEAGRRLASRRDDLIAAGIDPAALVVPLHPAPSVRQTASKFEVAVPSEDERRETNVALIKVDHGDGLTSFPIAERVRGGWQSGVHFYPDASVTVRTYLVLTPLSTSSPAEHDEGCEAEYVVGATCYSDCGCADRASRPTPPEYVAAIEDAWNEFRDAEAGNITPSAYVAFHAGVLAARPLPETEEREYGGRTDYGQVIVTGTREEVEAESSIWSPPLAVVRRRPYVPAGPWLPIPESEGNDR